MGSHVASLAWLPRFATKPWPRETNGSFDLWFRPLNPAGFVAAVLSIISHGPPRQRVAGPSAVLGLLRETFVASLGFGGEWRETRVDR